MVEIIKKGNPGQGGWLSQEIDEWLNKKATDQLNYQRKWTIRPSELGECTRKIVYDILNFPVTQTIEPKIQRVFDNGHSVHERYLKTYLSRLGVMCKIWIKSRGRWKKVDFSEVMVEDKNLWVKGAPDAVIYNPHTGQRYIFELKSIRQESFWKLSKPYESHILQAHMYMYLVGISKTLLLYENKNTQDIKEFEISFDSDIMTYIVNKIAIIQSYVRDYENTGQLPAREYDAAVCQNCKFAFRPTGCITSWNKPSIRKKL